MSRSDELNKLYELLFDLRERVGGCRYLRGCTGRTPWPERGVYFFFESGETRNDGITSQGTAWNLCW